MRLLLLTAIGLTFGSMAAGAAERDDRVPLLSATDLDPQAMLPPPPAAGSAQAAAELAELHTMQQRRSPAEIAAAKLDGATKNAAIFAEALGPSFDLTKLPATKKLFDMVRATEKQVVDHGKQEFKRQRPWIIDVSIDSCSKSDQPLSSYPSGHASMAFSMAGVLARLVPDRAGAILARAARYGESHIVCEQHFRSDVTAGEALGLMIADRLMAKPAFATAFEASRVELMQAGLLRTA